MVEQRSLWLTLLIDLVRATVYGVVIIALLIGASAALGNAAEERHTLKAIACELAVPVTSSGRDPDLVAECFRANGLEPPVFGEAP